jgi:oligopeptide/dipeptide ABC transporter ATP-binding protein
VEGRRRRIILKGDVPNPANPPSGCRFHTRCWLREKLDDPTECTTIEPEQREIWPGHEVACHFAERVDGSAEQAQVTGASPPPSAPGWSAATSAPTPPVTPPPR